VTATLSDEAARILSVSSANTELNISDSDTLLAHKTDVLREALLESGIAYQDNLMPM